MLPTFRRNLLFLSSSARLQVLYLLRRYFSNISVITPLSAYFGKMNLVCIHNFAFHKCLKIGIPFRDEVILFFHHVLGRLIFLLPLGIQGQGFRLIIAINLCKLHFTDFFPVVLEYSLVILFLKVIFAACFRKSSVFQHLKF
jgi:hypothetical protein